MKTTGRSTAGMDFWKIRAESPSGRTRNTAYFSQDGRMKTLVRGGLFAVPGTWRIEASRVCTTEGGRGRECWPIDLKSPQGRVSTITSDRGQTIKVTYLDGPMDFTALDPKVGGISLASLYVSPVNGLMGPVVIDR